MTARRKFAVNSLPRPTIGSTALAMLTTLPRKGDIVMLAKSLSATCSGVAVVAIASLVQLHAFAQVPAAPQAPGIAQPQNGQLPAPNGDPNQPEMKVLDQGPLHEAFAEAVVLEKQQPIVINRDLPEPINELVPEARPEGDNIQWIPGYWMWSDQQNDFIWVSGVWRDIPPGRRWVPGNWTAIDGGFQWVPGFWAGEQVQEVQMLPLPPETLEAGPSSPAPAANYFWVPGCWMWNNGAYGWRGGYWYAGQQNWVWIPDRYCYTPRGVIFVSGYWDYLLAYRGLAYAPVWWSRPVWGTPGWGYRPYYGINSSLLLSALFLNRHHHHYYFGRGNWNNDFYRPWWKNGGGKGYDPFCSYHRWHDGRNRDDWANNYRRDFDRFQQDRDRPGNGPHRTQLVARADIRQRQQIGDVKLQHVSKIDLDRSRQQIDQFKNIRDSRQQAENRLKEMGAGKLTFDDLKNGNLGQSGREPLGRTRDRQGPDIAKGAGTVQRDVIRGNGKKLDGDAMQNAGTAAFRLPPVTRTTAKVPANGANAAIAKGSSNGNGPRADRMLSNGSFRGGDANGVKFEDLQRQLRNRGVESPVAGQGNAGGEARSANSDATAPLPDVIRQGRTLQPGSASNLEALRSRGGSVRSEDLRRQLNLDGSPSFPQGSARTMEGRARIEIPQNRLQTPGNISEPREMQYRSRNLQVPDAGRSSSQPRMNPGSGQSSFRGIPSGGGETRSFRSLPSGGGQPMIRSQGGGGGAEMRSSRGPASEGGGQSTMRSRGDGGGSPSRGGGGGRGRGRD